MALIPEFSPPSNLTDMSLNTRSAWSSAMSHWFSGSQAGISQHNNGPRTQFYHPVLDDPGDVASAVVTWTAFPRQVQLQHPTDVQRWAAADSDRSF